MNQRHSHLVAGTGSVEDARQWITSADAILISAGAGLSAAAGYDYTDTQRFAEPFPALHSAGFQARYQLIGAPIPATHLWGFWAIHTTDVWTVPALVEGGAYSAGS